MLEGLPLKLKSLTDLGLADDVEEYGKTHEENAIIKARYFFDKANMPTLGEDSGVYADAFPGELGVYTRRFRGRENLTDEEWIWHFLKDIEQFPKEKRGAGFICVAAIILDKDSYESPFLFRGETRGVITHKLEAPLKKGIPLSSCFRPEGMPKVYAALDTPEKNRVSHRGKALHAAKDFLFNSKYIK